MNRMKVAGPKREYAQGTHVRCASTSFYIRVVIRIAILPAALILLGASAVGAQRVEPVGPRARPDTMLIPHVNKGHHRFFASLGGSVLGAIAGGYLGYQILPHDCQCDDPGLDALVYGGLAGMTVGAALGAAGPGLRSVCSYDRRLKRSLIGATLVAGASYIVAGGPGNSGTLIAVHLGGMGGSLAALGQCWKSRM